MTKDLIRLFTDNAFLLLANRQQIMKDSRMCFAPIAVSNGLAYIGAFKPATLGAYVEWWSVCAADSLRMNDAKEKSLVYRLAGSPLSGANLCMQVYEDGRTEVVLVDDFRKLWKPFVKIVNRYAEQKECCQPYTLQEVIDILSAEEEGRMKDDIHTLFLEAEINRCNVKLQSVVKERDEFREKFVMQLLKNNEEQVRLFYDDFLATQKEMDEKILNLREERKSLRKKLRKGDIGNVPYQRMLMPINEAIRELQYTLTCFRYDKLKMLFPKESITIEDIERYFANNSKNEHEENFIAEKS